MQTIVFRKKNYSAALDAATGRLLSFRSGGKEMLFAQESQPLMELRVLDAERSFHCLTEEGAQIRVEPSEACCRITVSDFPDCPGLTVGVTVEAGEESLIYTTEIDNGTAGYVETLACPCVQITGRLEENGGEGQVFWGFSEGALIRNAELCLPPVFFGEKPGDAINARARIYPGLVNLQYLAYLNGDAGLYFGAHDVHGMPKLIAPCKNGGGLRLDMRLYVCVEPGENRRTDYPVVLAPCGGRWESPAEIYRAFIEAGEFPLPPKVGENPRIPGWVSESPVVVIYPPRSVRGTGYMGPNEFFPYVQGLKYLDDLAEAIDSRLLSFLPYWEGTAPWAPPFVWPPYGGEIMFNDYVEEMHRRGWYVSLYCSGLHWTDHHFLVPSYDMTRYREANGLTEKMCRLPDGRLTPGICDSIRTGHSMCVACKETTDIAEDQFGHILRAGVDYVQYFDQHMGGEGLICYADDHGHPACHGIWNTEAMSGLYQRMNDMIDENGGVGSAAFGAEGAVGDYFCKDMFFNDLRWQLTLRHGEPVPAYNYILHEYAANFMGNQCSVDHVVSRRGNPDSLLHGIAYSFTAGDALTLVLKSGGEIHYDWGLSWLEPGPRQEPVRKLVRNLNALRKGALKPFLYGGRMLPTPEFSQPGEFVMTRRDASRIVTGEVLSSCWQAQSGEKIQLLTNFREKDITVKLSVKPTAVVSAEGEAPADGDAVTVPALSAVAVRFD